MPGLRHLKVILILPVTVTIIIPLLIVLVTCLLDLLWLFLYPTNLCSLIGGPPWICAGVFLIYKTNRLFATIGKGTLAPWDPPEHLVVAGIYQHVRNPMILGVILVLLGEAILLGAIPLFLWFLLFWLGNHIHFIRTEEPALVQRFGDEYLRYKANVPRWIPRLKPWELDSGETNPRAN
jgi:protein-S-isoprenylcysteine O-methyltransferase Ste14